MRTIKSISDLRSEILLRETEQAAYKQQVVGQFSGIVGQFKPADLLNRTLRSIGSSQSLIDNLVIPLLGSAAGYLAKSVVVFGSENKKRQELGNVIQKTVSSIIVHNPETVKSIGRYLYQQIFKKKMSSR